jgi:fructokinase
LVDSGFSAPNGRPCTVILFGEILVDMFPDRRALGGAPFNVARHLKAFGLHPVLISRTGNDALRDELMTGMSNLGMDTGGLQSDPIHPTGQVLVHMEGSGHSFEILPGQAYDFIDARTAGEIALASSPGLLYFGTLAQRHPVSRRALESLFCHIKAPRFLDINLREPWYDVQTLKRSLGQADILKLNSEELRLLDRPLHLGGTDKEDLAATLMHDFDLSTILVTCGDEGAWLLARDGTLTGIPAQKDIRIVDTVGAGDGFASVFILGLFKHWTPEQVLLRADHFARSICGIHGAIPEDGAFYAPFLQAWNLDNGDH